MPKEENKVIFTEEDVRKLLDSCYEKCLYGVLQVSPGVEELAKDYLKYHRKKEEACKVMLRSQIAKCATSGFLTSFGGIFTLPVAFPANLASNLYVQMRMIACVAYMNGYELRSEQTQTFVYACLAGVDVKGLVKPTDVKVGAKLTCGVIKKVPAKVLMQINKKVLSRLVARFGSKGILNLGKLLPGVGAVVGGGFDLLEAKEVADRAYKWFHEGDFSV